MNFRPCSPLFSRGSELTKKNSVIGPHALLVEPTLIAEPEAVQQVPDYRVAVRGSGPTGDWSRVIVRVPLIRNCDGTMELPSNWMKVVKGASGDARGA